MDVSVIVGTFGDPSWQMLAQKAIASAYAQTLEPRDVIHVHGSTLYEARNRGAELAAGEWLCFLDADDQLEPGYLAALAAHEHEADLLAPAVEYVFEGGKVLSSAAMPKVASHAHDCTHDCLTQGNYLVVGTLVRKTMFDAVGGFESWEFYEDWALWLRCRTQLGATAVSVPEAVYIATHRFRSRNKAHRRPEKEAMHWQIHSAIVGVPA